MYACVWKRAGDRTCRAGEQSGAVVVAVGMIMQEAQGLHVAGCGVLGSRNVADTQMSHESGKSQCARWNYGGRWLDAWHYSEARAEPGSHTVAL